MRTSIKVRALSLGLLMLLGLWAMGMAADEEKPRYGGMLDVALAGDPPSMDMHQEQTFMVAIPMGPPITT